MKRAESMLREAVDAELVDVNAPMTNLASHTDMHNIATNLSPSSSSSAS